MESLSFGHSGAAAGGGGGGSFVHLIEDDGTDTLIADYHIDALDRYVSAKTTGVGAQPSASIGPEGALYLSDGVAGRNFAAAANGGIVGNADAVDTWLTYSVTGEDFARIKGYADGSLHLGGGEAEPDLHLVYESGWWLLKGGGSFQVGDGGETAYSYIGPDGLFTEDASGVGADTYVSCYGDGHIEMTGHIQMKSADGTLYNVTVTDDGTLDVVAA